jgi:predicted aspartyl protease
MKRLFIALAMIASPIAAQEAAPESISDHPAETLAAGEDANNRMTVPVMVNGQGPFQFIVDTGADRSAVSAELAEKLGLPEDKKVRLISMSGVDQVSTVRVASLAVTANRQIKNVVLPALQERYLGADGLLGIDALKGQRIHLDFAGQTVTVEPGTKEKREKRDPNVIVVQARSRLGQLVLVDADANGEEVWVVVDTGGQNSVANSAMRRLMARQGSLDSFKPISLMSVVGDRVPADYTIVGSMRIGGIRMGNAAVAFADVHPFRKFGLTKRPAMLLGMEGLRSFRRVTIDFANKEVRFQVPEGVIGAASR